MNLANLIKSLPVVANWPEQDLFYRTRLLREAGMLPTGYGVHAPDLEARDGAVILLGIAAVQRAANVVEAVTEYSRLVDEKGHRLIAVLAAILSSPNDAYAIRRVVVNQTWREAVIVYRDGRTRVFQPANPKAHRTSGITVRAEIATGTLHQLAIWVGEEDDVGELVIDE